jgi:hypothetical protein
VGSCECDCVGQLKRKRDDGRLKEARQMALAETQVQSQTTTKLPLPSPSEEEYNSIRR